ncbi:hypothetical protein EK904_002352 [Melospiza melodia maxima]|nr:hypothetical protein EK904_002352 [Melospiza melodia maxima]
MSWWILSSCTFIGAAAALSTGGFAVLRERKLLSTLVVPKFPFPDSFSQAFIPKYYGLDTKWGDIEQWMEDSERYSRRARRNASASDEDERMSVGSRGSLRVGKLCNLCVHSHLDYASTYPVVRTVCKLQSVCVCVCSKPNHEEAANPGCDNCSEIRAIRRRPEAVCGL